MAKVHKGFRLEEDMAEAVAALRADGETESACYARVIKAGVAALTEYEPPTDGEHGEPPTGAGAGVEPSGIVREYIDALRAQVESQGQQLAEKDAQIERLQGLAATQTIIRAEGGAWSRIKAFFGRGGRGADE